MVSFADSGASEANLHRICLDLYCYLYPLVGPPETTPGFHVYVAVIH